MLKYIKDSIRDLMPIIIVIAFFQLFILQQPFPNPSNIIIGTIAIVLGLALFVQGLNMSLFPIGENMSGALIHKGSIFWLILFAFALGFGTTIAEPALIAISAKAAEVQAQAGIIPNSETNMKNYALGLRYSVALSVGLAVVVGIIRIIKGWPIQWIIIGGYIMVVTLTNFAPKEIIGIAYDSGGVTTSTITVPLVTALGIGLSTVIKGRNPMIDGFGIIAFASLFPIIFVLIYGMAI